MKEEKSIQEKKQEVVKQDLNLQLEMVQQMNYLEGSGAFEKKREILLEESRRILKASLRLSRSVLRLLQQFLEVWGQMKYWGSFLRLECTRRE